MEYNGVAHVPSYWKWCLRAIFLVLGPFASLSTANTNTLPNGLQVRTRLGLSGDLMAQLATYGPPPADLLENIAILTPDGINQLASQVLDPDNFAFTVVGPMFDEDLEDFELH